MPASATKPKQAPAPLLGLPPYPRPYRCVGCSRRIAHAQAVRVQVAHGTYAACRQCAPDFQQLPDYTPEEMRP